MCLLIEEKSTTELIRFWRDEAADTHRSRSSATFWHAFMGTRTDGGDYEFPGRVCAATAAAVGPILNRKATRSAGELVDTHFTLSVQQIQVRPTRLHPTDQHDHSRQMDIPFSTEINYHHKRHFLLLIQGDDNRRNDPRWGWDSSLTDPSNPQLTRPFPSRP